MLGIGESDVKPVMQHLERCQTTVPRQSSSARVTFQSDHMTQVASFLNCFTCRPHVGEGGQATTGAITLNRDLSEDRKEQLGKYRVFMVV